MIFRNQGADWKAEGWLGQGTPKQSMTWKMCKKQYTLFSQTLITNLTLDFRPKNWIIHLFYYGLLVILTAVHHQKVGENIQIMGYNGASTV